MSIISRLSVVLGLDSAQFNAGLGKAEDGLGKFNQGSLATKAALVGLGYQLINTAKEALSFANDMTELAKANEMSVASVLELTQALSTSGGKVENTGKLIASFTNKLDEAVQGSQKTRDKFKELGVSLSDLGKLSEEDLLKKTIDGLSKIEDPVRRNALAFDLLGKAAKGVDFKDLNEDLRNLKGAYDQSEESFRKIEQFGDRIAAAWFNAKVNIANTIVAIAEIADKEMEKVFFKQKKYANQIEGILAGDLFYKESNDGKFKPFTDNKTYAPNFNATVVNTNRPLAVSDEQQKILDKIESQRNTLQQNLLTIQQQTKELTTTASTAEKLKLEFAATGKYNHLANTELAKQTIHAAELYDAKKKEVEVTRINYDLNVQRTKQLAAEWEMSQQLSANENIRLQTHKDSIRFRLQDLEAAIQRENLEKAMAGQADIIVQRALKLFDIQQQINREKRQNGLLSEAEIEQIRTTEQALVEAEEANKRAQNTFQAGWDRAYENFKLMATDSAQMGSRAFQGMTQGMEAALDRFVKTGKLSFKELTTSIIQDLISIQLRAQATSFFQTIFDNIGGLFGSAGGVPMNTPSFDSYYNMPRFANGGTPPLNTPSIVGENGPELFVPRTSGTIVPNAQLSSMMAPPQQIIYNGPVIENMNAIDTQTGVQFLARNKDTIWSAYQSASRSMPMQRGG